MEKDKFQNAYKVFIKWVENNVVTRKSNFTEIKLDFMKFMQINEKDDVFNFISENDMDLIIMDWICTLVNKKILIKEENLNGITYIYNQKKLNDAQKNIIKKYNLKKKAVFTVAIILAVLIIVTFIFSQVKEENEKKRRKEEIALQEKNIAEEIVKEVAEEYCIEDIQYDHIETDSLSGTVYYKSDLFDSLSDTNKLLFITSVKEKTRLRKIFPSGSKAAGLYYDLVVVSKGHEYEDFTTDGESWLRKDNIRIFMMETEYARIVEESLKTSLSTPSNSSSSSKYYSVDYNYYDCYPSKPHYVCYEEGRCRCVRYVNK